MGQLIPIQPSRYRPTYHVNSLNAELNPICHLLALLGGATIVISRLRVKLYSLSADKNYETILLFYYTKFLTGAISLCFIIIVVLHFRLQHNNIVSIDNVIS
jgi:hypothetical protein